jgi:hypothetical protein
MRIATIRAFAGERASARGQGRKDGNAACRALRNLLRNQEFRRRKSISVDMNLFITNAPRPRKGRNSRHKQK